MSKASKASIYSDIITDIFFSKYKRGMTTVEFTREDIGESVQRLNLKIPPKNFGDLLYYFRFRHPLPKSIQQTAQSGMEWTIKLAGRGRYRFVVGPPLRIIPNMTLAEIKIPDATPGIIAKYALSDEQALLAKIRYNRLVDIFTGVTCYSLQNHLRTQINDFGQIETDEIYVGVDRRGVHYVFPVQAKGAKDQINIAQVEQDIALCREKFPELVCRPIAAQFVSLDLIVLFELVEQQGQVRVVAEKHYRLVPPEDVTIEDIREYCVRGDQ